jgi:CSLREA domain-containing protein
MTVERAPAPRDRDVVRQVEVSGRAGILAGTGERPAGISAGIRARLLCGRSAPSSRSPVRRTPPPRLSPFTRTDDPGPGACNSDCSLREAVLAANAGH